MAARRETVWINTDIRKTPEFDTLSAAAFGLWTRLPFLVDEHHRVPDLSVIADDGHVGCEDAARLMDLMDEFVRAGFVDALSDGARYMSALSRRFYSFSEPAEEEAEVGNREVDA
jgi:hypothetical protein